MVPDHVAKRDNVRPPSSTSNQRGFYLEDELRNVCFVDVLHQNKPDFGAEFNTSGKDGAAKTRLQLKRPERGTASPEPLTQTFPLRQMSEKRRSDVCTAWSTCSGNQNPKRSFWKRTGTSQRTQRRARTTGSSRLRRSQRQRSPKFVFLRKTQRHTAERQRRTQQAATKHFPQKKKILW